MPTKKARQQSAAAQKLRTQIRDLICTEQEITDTEVGLVDCIIAKLDGTVSQDLRNRVHGALGTLKSRNEIVLVQDSTYSRGGTAQQSALISARWANSTPDPSKGKPMPPPNTSGVRDTPPQQPPTNTPAAPEAPKPTRATPRAELFNYLVAVLRDQAKDTGGQIRGGVRPITRQVAPWLSDGKLSDVTKELGRLGYINVQKRGGPNTIVLIDYDLPPVTPEQIVQAKTGNVVRDAPAQEPDSTPTPAPASEPVPKPTDTVDETTLAAILVTTEEIVAARDQALAENVGLRQQVAAQEASNHELRQQLTTLRGDHEAQSELLEDVDQARNDLARKLGDAEQQIADLKKELVKVREERSALQGELNRQVDPAKAVLERLRHLAGKPATES